MDSLLIISPFSPAQTPNTLRWNAILEEWKKKDHSLHVLTSRDLSEAGTQRTEDTHVFRTGFHTLYDLGRFISGRASKRNIPNHDMSARSGHNQIVNRLVDYLWRSWYWPDGSMLFLISALRHVRRLNREYEYRNVISVGLPFSCHLLAMRLKEENPGINWIMDIQDPFSYSDEFRVNNFRLHARRNQAYESRAFAMADRIVLTNHRAQELYEQTFPGHSDKMQVIPPLLESSLRIQTPAAIPDDGKIKLCYYGSFYEGVRSPGGFLELMEYLRMHHPCFYKKLCCYFIGEQTEFSMSQFRAFPEISDAIVFRPLLDRADLYEYIQNSDVLLNFGNSTDYHLPSKVVEFLYFQKPLLNFVQRQDDSTRRFLDGKLHMLNLEVTHDKLEEMAQAFMSFIQSDHTLQFSPDAALETYGSGAVAAAYWQLLS